MEIKNRFTGLVIFDGDLTNLCDADLRGANLRGADLRGADLQNCSGNRDQIRSIFCLGTYPITYTSEIMQIGCERHLINEWRKFDDGRILKMEGKTALEFWRESKDFIFSVLDKFPATPTK